MQTRIAILTSLAVTIAAPAFAQECPENPSHLPPVIAETSAWCPTCAKGALEEIDATMGEAAALNDGVATEVRTIAAIVRSEESGSANPNYGAITVDSGGLTYGAYQFDSNSGELGQLLNRYIARGGQYSNALKGYASAMSHGRHPNDANLRSILKKAANDPVMQQTQDDMFADVHIKPSMQKAADLGIRSPMGVALYIDIQTNGGIASVISTAKSRAGSIHSPGDETRFIQAMLDAREARYRRLARHGYGRYLSGWLARNNDFRKALANNALGLSGKIRLPHIGESFCGGDHQDARAFGLYMASIAQRREGADEVAVYLP